MVKVENEINSFAWACTYHPWTPKKKKKNCPILSLNLDFDGQAASILALTGNIIYKKTSIKDAKLQNDEGRPKGGCTKAQYLTIRLNVIIDDPEFG